eukprot:TRINITY_DN11314_c0_g1_i1.p1 TRINITY_DN11314_c0_g1~~TRINITY_DN11314_c0_g1_i1.p1  ORF type:complete len:754 (-),score=196.47 TRINITY_DN11314_c0_g1_i1:105-2366(-)
MKFLIEELEVYFPYSYIYPEQYNYMVNLKRALDAGKGSCVLEMPSGTGKTVTLLSFITSYKLAHPEMGKFVYCTRTVPEIEKALEEARRVIAYRNQELGSKAPDTLCIGLSSRRNFCVHPEVGEEKDPKMVDSKCRDLTASWVRDSAKNDPSVKLCNFYEGFERDGKNVTLNGIYSIEDLKEFGRKQGWCPYFLARHAVNHADIVIFSYSYIIDPKISALVTKDFPNNCVVVFDEAHNIDNACIDALSVNITKKTLEHASKNITKLSSLIQEVKRTDTDRLKREYDNLVEGLARSHLAGHTAAEEMRADPILAKDAIQEVVPGSIRRAEHFVALMKRIVEFLKMRLRVGTAVSEFPISFINQIYQAIAVEPRVLTFCSGRLASLLYTLEVREINQFVPLGIVADFATLVSTYSKGFIIIIDPLLFNFHVGGADPTLQFSCLDASLALKPVLEKFRSVVITSGTISPLDMYSKILNIKPVLTAQFSMTLSRKLVCPIIVTRGNDQVAMTSAFDARKDPAVIRNFGNLVVEISACVPDGVVCFFPSYGYMEEIVSMWNDMQLLNSILTNKLLFVETPDPTETAIALESYRKACNSGRGAVLFSVARGKVSEGIDFDHQYGRAVILFGIPYVNTQSKILRARLEFLRDNYQIKESEFLTFDAMRTAAQCVGRVIRGKTDYGLMIFADKRYGRADKIKKLPNWIAEALDARNVNHSTESAVGVAKQFLKEMAQPYTREDQLGKSLWTYEDVLINQAK